MEQRQAEGQWKILVVDDDEGNLFTFDNNFRNRFQIETYLKPQDALKSIETNGCDVLITDQRMPSLTGFELIKRVKEIEEDAVCLLFSAYTDIDILKDCINSNLVFRFLEKPFDFRHLEFEILQAIDKRRLLLENRQYRNLLQNENAYLREEMDSRYENIIGGDGDLRSVLERARQAAQYDSAVLISGETGTGKEMLARFIHRHSTRRDKPFVSMVCSMFGSGVLESELFGHEKGAFTGAHNRRIGRFEAAHTGTLFLDEIGDVSPEVQKKLLRVLQEKEFERVGGNQTVKVDVRIISATNKNLEEMVVRGEFRDDLYYRLNVVPFELPPLRQRPHDIVQFIDYFIERFNRKFGRSIKGISPQARDAILAYDWPGNIREMSNVFERAFITTQGDTLQWEDLALNRSRTVTVEGHGEISPENIRCLLNEHRGNKTRVAEVLGISRQYLHRKIKEFQINE